MAENNRIISAVWEVAPPSGVPSPEPYDVAADLAISLLYKAGLRFHDVDDLGEKVSDEVQSALMIAIGRSTKLRAYIRDLVTKGGESHGRVSQDPSA
jgi:hypothetical protein